MGSVNSHILCVPPDCPRGKKHRRHRRGHKRGRRGNSIVPFLCSVSRTHSASSQKPQGRCLGSPIVPTSTTTDVLSPPISHESEFLDDGIPLPEIRKERSPECNSSLCNIASSSGSKLPPLLQKDPAICRVSERRKLFRNGQGEIEITKAEEENELGGLCSSSSTSKRDTSIVHPVPPPLSEIELQPLSVVSSEVTGDSASMLSTGLSRSERRENFPDRNSAARLSCSYNMGSRASYDEMFGSNYSDEASSVPGYPFARELSHARARGAWGGFSRPLVGHHRSQSPPPVFGNSELAGDEWQLTNPSNLDSPDENRLWLRRNSEPEEGRRRRMRRQVLTLPLFNGNLEGSLGHYRRCPSSRHRSDAQYAYETQIGTEERNTGAAISRIVMLAEALFEVLDEIHRHSVTFSRPAPLPAPASVVDSLPVRIHKKSSDTEIESEDTTQCYICLGDYEDDDWVRILPCNHEYHMECIDKWLKEMHRACPLCRRNICETVEGV